MRHMLCSATVESFEEGDDDITIHSADNPTFTDLRSALHWIRSTESPHCDGIESIETYRVWCGLMVSIRHGMNWQDGTNEVRRIQLHCTPATAGRICRLFNLS